MSDPKPVVVLRRVFRGLDPLNFSTDDDICNYTSNDTNEYGCRRGAGAVGANGGAC